MIKHFYILLTLPFIVACHHDVVDDWAPVDSTIPISVAGELNKTTTTRADMKGLNSSAGWLENDKFAVTAQYYYSTTTTLAQQFMYEVPVTYTKTATGNPWYGTTDTYFWNYTPVKYWPQQGYLDFYAVFPVDYLENNLDRQRLYHENIGDTILQTRFYLDKPKPAVKNAANVDVYTDAEEQWDLMFSHRPHLSKPDITTPVRFLFTHAEMAVRFWTKDLDIGNYADITIDKISLNNIHTGGLITATDITDWQSYYAEYPNYSQASGEGRVESTAGATTPVSLAYDWNWDGSSYNDDVRDTYTQTMDFLWGYTDATGFHRADIDTQINSGNKVFIIPPQCLGETSGSSITVWYTFHDAGGTATTKSYTFNVNLCGEPGDVLDIHLNSTLGHTTTNYEIEVISATLTPWEEVIGRISTDLEK